MNEIFDIGLSKHRTTDNSSLLSPVPARQELNNKPQNRTHLKKRRERKEGKKAQAHALHDQEKRGRKIIREKKPHELI